MQSISFHIFQILGRAARAYARSAYRILKLRSYPAQDCTRKEWCSGFSTQVLHPILLCTCAFISSCSVPWDYSHPDGPYSWAIRGRDRQSKDTCTRACCAVLSRAVVSASLRPPWTVAHQAPPSVGFSRQEYRNGLPCPPPRDLPNPGMEPGSPALQADSLPTELPWKPVHVHAYE